MDNSPGAAGASTERALADLLASATALVARFPECFWFWHQEARLHSPQDVRLVVEHLRQYGDRSAWVAAQDLNQCLSAHFRKTS
jgi:hypothetical protein